MYDFCISKEIRIYARFLCGRKNVRADTLSRRPRDHCYSLPNYIFSYICDRIIFSPVIDLFASRINHKLDNYFSEGPDPYASDFDAFVLPWPEYIYAFPPIHLVDNFITSFLNQKLKFGLLICPFWPSQPYFPTLLNMLIDDPFLFSASILEDASTLPSQVSTLMACSISSSCVLQKEFQQRLLPVYSGALTPKLFAHTYVPGEILSIGAVKGKLVTAKFL